jgi:hypothetical protein
MRFTPPLRKYFLVNVPRKREVETAVVHRMQMREFPPSLEGFTRAASERLVQVECARPGHRHEAVSNADASQRAGPREQLLLHVRRSVLRDLLVGSRMCPRRARRVGLGPRPQWKFKGLHGRQLNETSVLFPSYIAVYIRRVADVQSSLTRHGCRPAHCCAGNGSSISTANR